MPQFSRQLSVVPLTHEAFYSFGDVVDASGSADDVANGGAAQVYRDRAAADFDADGGRIRFNAVRTAPQRLPLCGSGRRLFLRRGRNVHGLRRQLRFLR